jgi:hypothetical protein
MPHTDILDQSDPPMTPGQVVVMPNTWGNPFIGDVHITNVTPIPAMSIPEKKKPAPTVDAEAIAKVISQLDLPKDQKAALASEFAEGLVEIKARFNRDHFINFVKEYSK